MFSQEILQLKESLRAVADPAALLTALFARSPVAFAVYGSDGRLVVCNDACRALFGSELPPAYDIRTDDILARSGLLAEIDRVYAGETVSLPVLWYDPRDLAGLGITEGRRVAIVTTLVPLVGDDARVSYVIATFRDETELRRDEEILRASRIHLEASQRIAHVGSWELDLVGLDSEPDRPMLCSDECYRIFGYRPGGVRPTLAFFESAIHPDDRAGILEAVRAAVVQGRAYSVEYRIVRPDGSERVVHTRAERVSDTPAPGALRLIGTSQDVTERVAARHEIERLNQGLELRVAERTAQLAAANRDLESFAYSVSHDLRAPLRGINGFAHLLVSEYGDCLPEDAGHYLNRIFEAARRMGALIDNLLDFSRLGQAALHLGSIDTRVMLEEILEDLLGGGIGDNVEVALGNLPVCLADPGLLRQVFVNLLGNAIKFSRERCPARIEVDCSDASGRRVWSVRDNGIGFDMASADAIFEVFQRLHPGEKYEGAGVGLAIVKRIIQLHGGRIWAEALAGEGATFRFTLGAARSEEAAA